MLLLYLSCSYPLYDTFKVVLPLLQIDDYEVVRNLHSKLLTNSTLSDSKLNFQKFLVGGPLDRSRFYLLFSWPNSL